MKNVDRALVIGGGVGGLATAALFAQRGAQVDVVEVKDNNDVLGVGINQPANSLRVLRFIGVLDELLETGATYDRLRFHDHHGNVVVEIESKFGGDVPANCGLSRGALATSLLEAAQQAGASIHYGTQVELLADKGDQVTATLSNGSTRDYDLVVAFDGLRSQTRRSLFGTEYDPQYTGYAVWRVTLPRPASVDCCQLFHGIDTKAGMIPLSPTHMYLFVVTAEPGNPHYDPADYRALMLERLQEYDGVVAEMRDRIEADSVIVYSPLNEVRLPAPWNVGRIVLGGDAAHACAPHLTQGAAMALEDAAVLTELVDRDIPLADSLAEYAARRLPRVSLVADVSRGILQAEMSVTPETHAQSLADLQAHLPERLGFVESKLNQSA